MRGDAAYWKTFDTSDLAAAPGPKVAEVIDARISEMAGRYSATYPSCGLSWIALPAAGAASL